MKMTLSRLLAAQSLFLLNAVVFTIPLWPQEVEIDVAGPWSYVVDPGDATRIVLIAPITPDHEFHIFSGWDVSAAPGSEKPNAGSYILDVPGFDRTKCPRPSPMPSGPYPVTVPPATVAQKLNSFGSSYVISLPMPCRFESYAESRMKVAAGGPEMSYPTWMVLHYTVPTVPAETQLSNKPGTGSSYNKTFQFSSGPGSTSPPYAISIVLYNIAAGPEDRPCDAHSANAFDAVVKTFWGQAGLYRAFPELFSETGGMPLQQSHRYNSSCATTAAATPMTMMSHRNGEISDLIRSLRNELGKNEPNFERATHLLTDIRNGAAEYWQGKVPGLVRDELDLTGSAIKSARKQKSSTAFDSELVLWLTKKMVSPGRIDCHATQVSVNGAVK